MKQCIDWSFWSFSFIWKVITFVYAITDFVSELIKRISVWKPQRHTVKKCNKTCYSIRLYGDQVTFCHASAYLVDTIYNSGYLFLTTLLYRTFRATINVVKKDLRRWRRTLVNICVWILELSFLELYYKARERMSDISVHDVIV